MSSKEQFRVTSDLEEHSIGLFGHLTLAGFEGFGEGWFNISEVRDFCSDFEFVVKSLRGEANLVAAQQKQDGSEYLERFVLRSYVISKTGIYGVHIKLSEYPYTDCRPEEILKISGELKVETQSVLTFISELRKLCEGRTQEANLLGGD